ETPAAILKTDALAVIAAPEWRRHELRPRLAGDKEEPQRGAGPANPAHGTTLSGQSRSYVAPLGKRNLPRLSVVQAGPASAKHEIHQAPRRRGSLGGQPRGSEYLASGLGACFACNCPGG